MRCCIASSTMSRLKDQGNSARLHLPPPTGQPSAPSRKARMRPRPPRASAHKPLDFRVPTLSIECEPLRAALAILHMTSPPKARNPPRLVSLMFPYGVRNAHTCQSASNFAPRSASKIDPILETGAAGSARPGEAGLGCAAGASADRWRAGIVRSGAVLEAPTLIAGLDDVAVVGETIEECGGHLWVAEHARPFAEGEIGGDDDRGAFVEAAEEME